MVTAQSQNPIDPDSIGQIDFGGDICIPPVAPPLYDTAGIHPVTGLPWDTYGFGQDSTYKREPPYPGYEEGDPFDAHYDPNCFDYFGIHVNGTPYNDCGCSRDSLTQAGQPCDPGACAEPYACLNEDPEGPPTQAGIAFANEVEEDLPDIIEAILLALKEEYSDSTTAKALECNSIRSEMDDLVDELEYDSKFIYGLNDEFYDEGMHANFSSPPKPLEIDVAGRDSRTIELENAHVSLYHCDLQHTQYGRLVTLLNQMLTTQGLEDITAVLLSKIQRFTADQVSQYQESTAFAQWIERELLLLLQDAYQDEYGVLIGENDLQSHQNHYETDYIPEELYAAIGEYFDVHGMFHPGKVPKVVEPWQRQFLRGERMVHGIHRAHYLDAIHKRNLATATLSGTVLPITISKEVMGKTYTILIDRITFSPVGATLDAFLIIEDPRSAQKLVFEGWNLSFGPNGVIGASELSLASEVSIRLNNAAKLIVHGTPETFVSWDCTGFTGVGLSASIEFCREFLTPLDSVSLMPLPLEDTTRVQAHFVAEMPAWGDFIAEISIDPFAVTKAEHIRWVVEAATIDFSDVYSPDFEFPVGYSTPYSQGNSPSPFWKGFHLSELSATFPAQFSNDGQDITVGVENLIIDDRGFSGEVFVAGNFVSLDDGSLGGWAFSIDTLQVVFVANYLTGGGMSGLINVPVFSSTEDSTSAIVPEDCFSYRATMHADGAFCFTVKPTGDIKAPLFRAGEIKLAPNSTVSIKLDNGIFFAKATLFGSLTIDASLGENLQFRASDITFERFEVQNIEPYFSPGLWGFPASIGTKLGAFEMNIKDIGLVSTGEIDEAALRFNTYINLSKPEINVTAGGALRIVGRLSEVDGRQKWIYKNFAVDGIEIDAKIKGNHVKGGLVFYQNDATFGSGFRGIVKARFKALGNTDISAVAQFGGKNDYKYFFVDALAMLGGTPTGPGLKLKGFGGGLYHHMNRNISAQSEIPSAPTVEPVLSALTLGQSLSGIIYIPDSSKSIGVKATVVVTTAVETAFSANLTFEILFNTVSDSTGGISNIWLYGNGRFMATVDFGQLPHLESPPGGTAIDAIPKPNLVNEVPVIANVNIAFDFNNNVIDGRLGVFLNTPFFKGVGAGGRMAWAELHFSKNEWYINIGTPSKPCGIEFIIPGLGPVANVTAYLDIGTNLEDMPPLPAKVRSLTGSIKPNPMRGTGAGFAMGASLNVNTGELKFLIFRAELQAGIGFDVLVRNYGDAICTNTNAPPGINGWYASGQVWAYLEGYVGIKIRKNADPIKILELGAAVALQARLPNPTWMQGAFGVRYSILGGLVKGSANFRITLGEQCQFEEGQGQPDLEIISELWPGEGSVQVDVADLPTAYFNVPVNTIFDISDGEEEHEYIVRITEARLQYRGFDIGGYHMVEEGVQLVFYPNDFMPANDTLTWTVSVQVLKDGNEIDTEMRSVTFVTGERPGYIPEANILATYPLSGQFNYYRKENNEKCYIDLKSGQPYLFNDPETRPSLILISMSGESYIIDYQYDYLNSRIDFALSSDIVDQNTIYKLVLSSGGFQSEPVVSTNPVLLPGYSELPVETGYVEAGVSGNSATSDKMFSLLFRVSNFETFRSKIEAFSSDYILKEYPGGPSLIPDIGEPFDVFEMTGGGILTKPLIDISADFTGNSWYHDIITQRLYKYYPKINEEVEQLSRSHEPQGVPPVKAIQWIGRPDILVTEENFISATIPDFEDVPLKSRVHIQFGVLTQIRKDYIDVQQQLEAFRLWLMGQNIDVIDPGTGEILYQLDPEAQFILENDYDTSLKPSPGTYTMLFNYSLPGHPYVKSSQRLSISLSQPY